MTLLYRVNVTLTDPTIDDDWATWMRDIHIPEVMETGCFTSVRMAKQIEPDVDNPTYAIEYHAAGDEIFARYQRDHAPALQKDHTQRYQGKFQASRTVHHVVYEP